MNTAVTAYLEELSDERKHALGTVRDLIHHIWPNVSVDMLYGMPTFHLKGKPLCSIASQKNYMVLYVMPYDLLRPFKNDLKAHDHGRSCIRFKRMDSITLDLFDRVIKYTGSQIALSKVASRDPVPHVRKEPALHKTRSKVTKK